MIEASRRRRGNGRPLSPTRLAPHSWRADPCSSNSAPPLTRQASLHHLPTGSQNIDFLAGKCRFLKARVGTSESAPMHWKSQILIFLHENVHFWQQKMVGWKQGNAKYWFSCRKMKVFEGTSGDKQKCVNAMETKNIDFPVWKCTFLATEDGWLEARERKI